MGEQSGSGQSDLVRQLVFATVQTCQAGGLVRGHSGSSLIDSAPQLVFATVHSFQDGGRMSCTEQSGSVLGDLSTQLVFATVQGCQAGGLVKGHSGVVNYPYKVISKKGCSGINFT